MIYLGIKNLATISNDVIIVTSSLTKDMTGKEDAYRAPAIRALCAITDDAAMLQAIERYMKQALVDRSPAIASSALVSAQHLGMRTSGSAEVIRRWVNEAQDAVSSDAAMVQYHALGLLYHIRKNDRLAVTKLVAKLTKSSLKSAYAVCLLIRITAKLLDEEDDDSSGGAKGAYFEFIEVCLRHKSEMVSSISHTIGSEKVCPRQCICLGCLRSSKCHSELEEDFKPRVDACHLRASTLLLELEANDALRCRPHAQPDLYQIPGGRCGVQSRP
jgi:hypothetical protein